MGNTSPQACLGEVSMPWKECSVMDERPGFVARLLDGEAMTEVCREFAISRKTGYKIFDRYQRARARGLERPLAAAGALRQPAAAADRKPDRRGQARQAPLGCPQVRTDPARYSVLIWRRSRSVGYQHPGNAETREVFPGWPIQPGNESRRRLSKNFAAPVSASAVN